MSDSLKSQKPKYRVPYKADRGDLSAAPHATREGIVDNVAEHRFELPVDGQTAFSYYQIDGNRITLLHTEVPVQLSGRGVGSRLAHAVFETIRASGRRVVAKCPFMSAYASRHPEYLALLDG
jgi:predicted GNAT family acetyltransferase